ncbi:hypothetical protein KO516_08945 [Citreicella sp. C3M06]|nr:hypothetical protein [Citreicella sp. C3M06]
MATRTAGEDDVNALAGLVFAALAATGAAAEDIAYSFHWDGANGYELHGGMAFDEAFLSQPEVNARDLSCFFIEGRKDGAPIGRWALGMLSETTTWTLTYLPAREAFAVYSAQHPMPQAWNMDGDGVDCGKGGFGFNIGNAAQDLCLDGQLLLASQVPPDRPFPATLAPDMQFPPDACLGPNLLSALELPR